ncbi:hypothetical protein EMCRGX_G006153 [Ephydatia muelleri]
MSLRLQSAKWSGKDVHQHVIYSNYMLNCDLAPTHAVVSFESDGTTSVVPFKNIVGGYSSSVKAGGVCEVQWNDKKKYAATVLAVGSSKEMTTVLDDHDYSDEPPSSDEAMLEVPGTKNLSGSESSPASVVKEPDTADDISDDYCVVKKKATRVNTHLKQKQGHVVSSILLKQLDKGTKLDCSSSEEVPFEKRRKTSTGSLLSELSDCSTSTDDCTTYQHNAMTVLTQTVSKQLQEMNNNIKSLITQQQHNMPSDSHDEWVKSDGFWLGDPNAHLKSGKKLWITSDQKEIANGNCTPTVSNRPLLNQAFVHGIRFESGVEPERWKTILQKNLNGKCRSFRRQLRMKPPLNDNQSAPSTAQKKLEDNDAVHVTRVEDAATAAPQTS